MKVHVVLTHPERASFNGQMADLAVATLGEAGHSVTFSDLYGMGFDPAEAPRHYSARTRTDMFDIQAEQRSASERATLPADVLAELERVEAADLLILQYPTWWFSAPAMLKGWVDRVLVYGRTYTSAMRYHRGKLMGRRAMLSVTFGGPESTFAHNGRNGDVDLLLWPMNMTLHYVGYRVLPSVTSFGIFDDGEASAARIARCKDALRDRLTRLDVTEDLNFNSWDDWNELGQLKPGIPGYSHFMRGTR